MFTLASMMVGTAGFGPAAPPPSEASIEPAERPAQELPAATSATAVGPAGPRDEAEPEPRAAVPVADPLPPAPASVPVSSLRSGSWRGRGWFQIGVDLTVPLGGVRPGRGSVRSAAGGVSGGWRARPWLGVGAGVSTFFHDSETRVVENELSGSEEEAVDLGRMTLFDVPQVRVFVPTAGRVEPWLDAAATIGVYHEPWGSGRWVMGARLAAGVAFWIGPAFSLDLSAAPRMLVVERSTGWMIQTGLGATIHW